MVLGLIEYDSVLVSAGVMVAVPVSEELLVGVPLFVALSSLDCEGVDERVSDAVGVAVVENESEGDELTEVDKLCDGVPEEDNVSDLVVLLEEEDEAVPVSVGVTDSL